MHKNKLYKKWLTKKDSASEAKYKNYRKIYNKMLRAAETGYYHNQFDKVMYPAAYNALSSCPCLLSPLRGSGCAMACTLSGIALWWPRPALLNYFVI